jgi:hypothetical protein
LIKSPALQAGLFIPFRVNTPQLAAGMLYFSPATNFFHGTGGCVEVWTPPVVKRSVILTGIHPFDCKSLVWLKTETILRGNFRLDFPFA